MKDVFELLEVEDLTTDLQLLHDVCGMDVLKKLIRNLNGLNFYIPKVTHMESVVLKYAKEHSTKPLKIIAKELGISEPHLKNILKR